MEEHSNVENYICQLHIQFNPNWLSMLNFSSSKAFFVVNNYSSTVVWSEVTKYCGISAHLIVQQR